MICLQDVDGGHVPTASRLQSLKRCGLSPLIYAMLLYRFCSIGYALPHSILEARPKAHAAPGDIYIYIYIYYMSSEHDKIHEGDDFP